MAATTNKSLARALSVQFSVIGALIMREIHLKFGREGIGFIWIFVEPVMFIGGVIGMRLIVEATGPSTFRGIDLLAMMFTGYPPLVVWRNCVNSNAKTLRHNMELLSHRRIQPVDIILSRAAYNIATVTMAFTLAYIVLLPMGLVRLPADWSWFLLGWFFHCWYALASGLIVFAISEMTDLIDRLIHVTTYLALPLCGMMYMVSWLPHSFQPYALLLPSVNAYEILRHGYFGDGVKTTWNMGYLILLLTSMTFLGLFLLKLAKRVMVKD